jgi:hypothetical protein
MHGPAWKNHNLKAEDLSTRTGKLRELKEKCVELDQVSNAGGNDAWRRWG